MDRENRNPMIEKKVIISINKNGKKYQYDGDKYPNMSPEEFLKSHNIDVNQFETVNEEYSPSYTLNNQTRYNGQVIDTNGYEKKNITITSRDIKAFILGFLVGIICLIILQSQLG